MKNFWRDIFWPVLIHVDRMLYYIPPCRLPTRINQLEAYKADYPAHPTRSADRQPLLSHSHLKLSSS